MSRVETPRPVTRPRSHEIPAISRHYAREWYWTTNDLESYECPDCGRDSDRVAQFEVHHVDGDPTNNDPRNLLGLCLRCHRWRHGSPNISALDVEEWKHKFEKISGGRDKSIQRSLL